MRAAAQLFLRKLDFATLALLTFDASRPWLRLGNEKASFLATLALHTFVYSLA
jgi:hypothetical protein